jgi:biotin transport system substrate-specific component
MAQISIPMPLGVPMTMQTFAVSLAGLLLGSKKGFLSSLVYVLLGAVGVPVFAHFSGGLGIVIGPTGGFLLSFPIMAWITGFGAEKGNWMAVALSLLLATIVNYICGMLFFVIITGSSLGVAFTACVLPFIPTTIIKLVAAGVLAVKIRERKLFPV